MKYLNRALLVMLLSGILIGCVPTDSPETAAEEWMQALSELDGNKLAERTCAAKQESLQDDALWLSAFSGLARMLIGQQTEGDISDLQFTAVSESADTAQIRVTGEMRVAVLLTAETQEVDETWQMVREGGRWKWCGSAETPKAGASLTRAAAAVPTPQLVSPTDGELEPTSPPVRTPVPPPIEPPTNWRLYVTELLVGDEAIESVAPLYKDVWYDWHPEPGWQFAAVKFVLENTSGQWAMLPCVGGKWGHMIDSGGYERSLEGSPQLLCPSYLIWDVDVYLPPGLQIGGYAHAELPQNQKPETFHLFLDYDGDGIEDEVLEADLSQATSQPPAPFASVRSELQISTPEHSFDFPKDRRVIVTSVQVEQPYEDQPASRVRVGMRVENTGGYNLSLDADRFVEIRGVTSAGNYFSGIEDQGGSFGGGELAPGTTAEGYIATWSFNQDPNEASEVLVILTVQGQSSSDIALFFAERRDLSADQAAIEALLRRHRDVLTDVMRTGDTTPLAEVYEDPSRALGDRGDPPLLVATCGLHDDLYLEYFHKTIDMNVVTWDFPTEASAIVKAKETVEEWRMTCPARDNWEIYRDAHEDIACYHLTKRDGAWLIASEESGDEWNPCR